MRTARGLAAALLTLALLSCSHAGEQVLLSQFFAASRLRDLTALRKYATVVFEPNIDGIVSGFEISAITASAGSKEVLISASVRLPDERTVVRNYAVRIEGGLITAITERPASPSPPRR